MGTIKHFVLRTILAIFLASFIGLAPFLQASAESYGTTELASVAYDGSNPNNVTDYATISPDGRYVYFESNATNLVAGGTSNGYNIYARDRQTGTTTLLDLNSSGVVANTGVVPASKFSISDGGRYLVFNSTSTNLVSSEYDSNNALFVRDLKSGVTSLIYQNSVNGQSVSDGQISGNGDWIVFSTFQPFSPWNDSYGQVYLINRNTLALTRITNGNNSSGSPQINYDGTVVMFLSNATNLTSSGTNGHQHVYVWNKSTNGITEADVSSSGVQANADTNNASMSGDGNKIAIDTSATNLVSTTPAHEDVYLHEVDNSTTSLVSTTPSGSEGNGSSGDPCISEDGHDILFISSATNLVSNDNLGGYNMYVKNLDDSSTTFVNYDTSGNQVAQQGFGNISADGQYVTYSVLLSNGYRAAYLRY